jgi:hypothetical protein
MKGNLEPAKLKDCDYTAKASKTEPKLPSG